MATVQDQFALLERKYGLPAGYLSRLWQIESASGTAMSTPLSSAKGHFAFTKGTAAQYGLKDPNNLLESAEATARLASDNAKILRARGIPVTGPTLYMAHQQGAGGASSVLGNPNALAADVTSLQAIRNNLPTSMRAAAGAMTSGQFSDYWKNKYLGITPSTKALASTVSQSAPAAAPQTVAGAVGAGVDNLFRGAFAPIVNTVAGREVITPPPAPTAEQLAAAKAAGTQTPAQAGYGVAAGLAALAQQVAAQQPKPANLQPVYNKNAGKNMTGANLAAIMAPSQSEEELKRMMGLLGGGSGGYLA